MTYRECVACLESLQIMPKSLPGLEKIKAALRYTTWFATLDPSRIIVVAGTNGKGTTCAALESLLTAAGKKTGFYSSPHLVSTTERIRLGGQDIPEHDFIRLFQDCRPLIEAHCLSHFEALTLMAGHYFFSAEWGNRPDYVVLEVGLGGEFDATNAFPHRYCGITKLGVDHENILGRNLQDIAQAKFGIVGAENVVVHHPLPAEVRPLQEQVRARTGSRWIEAAVPCWHVHQATGPAGTEPEYRMNYGGLEFPVNLAGERAAENVMTAIALFEALGFSLRESYRGLQRIRWPGRMQKAEWPGMACPLYLSGDHNAQGVESLLRLLGDFKWKILHLVAGIGGDKDAGAMLTALAGLPDMRLYLTVTPFKGRALQDYPEESRATAVALDENALRLLDRIAAAADPEDLCLVTGSLYLVGEILSAIQKRQSHCG